AFESRLQQRELKGGESPGKRRHADQGHWFQSVFHKTIRGWLTSLGVRRGLQHLRHGRNRVDSIERAGWRQYFPGLVSGATSVTTSGRGFFGAVSGATSVTTSGRGRGLVSGATSVTTSGATSVTTSGRGLRYVSGATSVTTSGLTSVLISGATSVTTSGRG